MSEIIFENTQHNITFGVTQSLIEFQHTQPQIAFIAVPGIGSGIEEAPIDDTSYTRKDAAWIQSPIISESVTKTVAADGMSAGVQDFDTFHEAMTWACLRITTNGAVITLELQNGIHLTNIIDVGRGVYNCTDADIKLISVLNDASLCTIQPAEITTNSITMFNTEQGGSIHIAFITLDLSLATGEFTQGVRIGPISRGQMDGAILKNASLRGIVIDVNSYFLFGFNNGIIDSCGDGILCGTDTVLRVFGTISNCNKGINMGASSRSFATLVGVTFIGNVEDTDIALNTIQNYGQLITDGTTPLIPDDSFGTTAERPNPVNNGFSYFDTTLGYLIAYNGTNWVDSIGGLV